jgi:hypothetical protein
MNIQEALMSLDSFDDDQWTADGAPKLGAVKDALGESVTRQQVIDVAPEFSRENMEIEGYGDKSEVVDEPVTMDPLDSLVDEKKWLEENVSRVQANIEHAKDEIAEWTKRLDVISDELLVLDPPLTNAQRARNYINASNEARLRRHAVNSAIISNLPTNARSVGTPLDDAYARRNTRGGTRPVR